ncbi:hypothetical protein KXD97_20435 [Mycobacterium sp. SMC-8]|uniref:hypothetical protein n=1 Tax=Mycobacterium sp. SMC-8 TaxID=2857060 RepID=UPI0021B1AA0F|nr:hypothetical protein [Mycobacterium sp. SMC-8]UXA10470.1 hypothetical protein KXD97_20435 [Mycobacterium sp. SMC-8]
MRQAQVHREAPVVLAATALALGISGCGEDAAVDSSNRGSGSDTEGTSVENAFIVPAFVPGECALQLDAGGEMRFTVTNNRPADTERLLGLTIGAAAQAHGIDSVAIPPKSTAAFGEANHGPAPDGRHPAVRLQRLDPGLRPATSTDVTFRFERAGDITLPVPVEACPVQTR